MILRFRSTFFCNEPIRDSRSEVASFFARRTPFAIGNIASLPKYFFQRRTLRPSRSEVASFFSRGEPPSQSEIMLRFRSTFQRRNSLANRSQCSASADSNPVALAAVALAAVALAAVTLAAVTLAAVAKLACAGAGVLSGDALRGSLAGFEVRWDTSGRPFRDRVVSRSRGTNHPFGLVASGARFRAKRSAGDGEQGEGLGGALVGEQGEAVACDGAE